MNTSVRSRVSKIVSLFTIIAVVSLSTQSALAQKNSGRHGRTGGKQASSQVKRQQGNSNSKGKVQQSNRSKVAGLTPPLNTDKGEFKTSAGKSKPTNRRPPGNAGESYSSKSLSGGAGQHALGLVDSDGWDEVPEGLMFGIRDRTRPASQTKSGTGNWPMPGPKQATNEEIIKALNNGTQLRSTGQQGNVGGSSKSALSKPQALNGRENSIECWIKAPNTRGGSKFNSAIRPRTYDQGGASHHDNWRENVG